MMTNYSHPGTLQPPPLRRLAWGALCVLSLSGCLQTDPPQPDDDIRIDQPPEDNGRRAGASSSTNWPNEFVNSKHKANWSFDSSLRIEFFEITRNAPARDSSVMRSGTIHLYPGKAIPALDSIPSIQWEIEPSSSIDIPLGKILATAAAGTDTIWFNVRLELDSLHGWFQGFQLEKSTGKLVETPYSPFPEKTTFLKYNWFYFKGSVAQVTSLLPQPAGSDTEISFYIPGTPEFCKAVSDSFRVGPLPKAEYPFRIIRATQVEGSQAETLIEVWELTVVGQELNSTFTLGEPVLTFLSKGKITLRQGE